MSSFSQIEEILLSLLKISSVTGDESGIATYVERFIADLKLRLRVTRVENNLIVEPSARAGLPPKILLVGHFDTVPPWENHTIQSLSDRMVGVGASDMKGGLAVLLALIASDFAALSPEQLPTVIFYCGEEGHYKENGLHKILGAHPHLKRAAIAFILEPTNNEVQVGCLGIINALLTVRGKQAHSARPWEGENAFYKALACAAEINRLAIRDVHLEGHLFRELGVITQAQTGGNVENVIPDTFTMRLYFRYGPDRTQQEAVTHLRSIVPSSVEVEIQDQTPAGKVPVKNKYLAAFVQQSAVPVHAKQAYTDVALLSANGIDAVNCGPGDPAQAHQRGEFVLRSTLNRSYEMYREFLRSPL